MYHQRKKFYCYWLSDYYTVMVTLSAQHIHKVKQELSFDVKREDNYHMLETFSFFSFISQTMLEAVLITSDATRHLSK